jgi:hypothetical protein
VTGRDRGKIALASGVANHGEPARLKRNAAGRVQAVQLAGIELRREPQVVRELMRRYEGRSG